MVLFAARRVRIAFAILPCLRDGSVVFKLLSAI
jgi:hypothetical protein